MDKRYYHALAPTRRLCPVCKRAVYSRGGIHPQCAVAQAERPGPIERPLPIPAADGTEAVAPTLASPAVPPRREGAR